MPTYDSINAGSFMGTFMQAYKLRMDHDKYVQDKRLTEGINDANTIGEFRKLRILNENMSDDDFLREFPAAYGAAMEAAKRQGIHKMFAQMGNMDPEVGALPVQDPNSRKFRLVGKDKEGKTVPATDDRSSDPSAQVSEFTLLELIDKAYFLAGTKHGLSGFTLDRMMAAGAVDDSKQPPGSSSSPSARTGTPRSGEPGVSVGEDPDADGDVGEVQSNKTQYLSPDIMDSTVVNAVENNPAIADAVTRRNLGDHYMRDGDTMHAGPGMLGSPGFTTAPLPEGMSPKRIDTRVIGIDTPEIANARKGTAAEPYGDAATAAAQRQLDQAETITTTPGVGDRLGPWERQVRHVDLDGKNLAGELLDQGLAEAVAYKPGGNLSRADEYAQREADARAAEVGMFESKPKPKPKRTGRNRASAERAERTRQANIQKLEEEIKRLEAPAKKGRGRNKERSKTEKQRQDRLRKAKEELEQVKWGTGEDSAGDTKKSSTEPGSSDFDATALEKTNPEVVEAAAQKDATAETNHKTIQDIAEAATTSAAKKVAAAQGNSVQAAINTVTNKDAQNVSYGYLLSTDGILASPNKLSPRQRAVVAASLFRQQWLNGALTPAMVGSMRNFVQTGRWLGEAKVLLDHNRGAFKALNDMEYQNSVLLQNERKIALQALTTESTLAKNDVAMANNQLTMAKNAQAMQIAKNQEERDAENQGLKIKEATNNFMDRIHGQFEERWKAEYGGMDSNVAEAKRAEGVNISHDIFTSILPALSVAALQIGGADAETIKQLTIGTPGEQRAKSIAALTKAASTGLLPQMQTLVMAYVKYNQKTGSGMYQGMRYPKKTFIDFITGKETKGHTFLTSDGDYNKWLNSPPWTPEKMKIIADALRVGMAVAPTIQG